MKYAVLDTHLDTHPNTHGIAALITVTVIALIVLIAGIGISQTGFVENALTSGEKESREAFYAAQAGIHDALSRIIRNKDCNNGVNPLCASYSFAVDDAAVAVTVSGVSSTKTITAIGTEKNKTRTLQAIAIINTATNKVTVTSWNELIN